MSSFLLTVGIIILLAMFVMSLYNKFVTLKTQIEASIQEIGNQLKRQIDLIPNLIASVKGYMKHEKGIFDDITEARKQTMEVVGKGGAATAQQLIDMGTKMNQALSAIRVVMESTPEIKAAAPTQKLMNELRDTSDKLMYSRRTLIDLSQDYNAMVMRIPSNFVAMLFGFKKQPGLKMADTESATSVSAEDTKTPKVEL